MATESVKFTIELGGNAYSGVVQLDNAVKGVMNSVKQATSLFDRLGNSAFMFESMIGAIEKISNGFDALVGNSLEFEQSQANMRTLMNGNAEAADALLSKIRSYSKATVYDTSGLVNAQKTMMAFGLEADAAFKSLQVRLRAISIAAVQSGGMLKLMGQMGQAACPSISVAIMFHLQRLHDEHHAARDERMYQLQHTSQICHIKDALNREFSVCNYAPVPDTTIQKRTFHVSPLFLPCSFSVPPEGRPKELRRTSEPLSFKILNSYLGFCLETIIT